MLQAQFGAMRAKLKVLIPIAIGLAVIAAVIAYNNKVTAPKTGDVEPVAATGNAEDAAELLIQDAAAEDAIMAEADQDLDILEQDSADSSDLSGAYDESAL